MGTKRILTLIAGAKHGSIIMNAYESGCKDRILGRPRSPSRHGWVSSIAFAAYYEGYDTKRLVQGWLFSVT